MEKVNEQLALIAEELEELPEILRDLVGPRCGEAVDRAREARLLLREVRTLLGADDTNTERN